MAVREGFKALPRRGLETGGLLIGRRRQAGNQVVIDIDDFEPVESEHVTGPSYVLSDADLRLLETKIAAREAASIVGFYRSHTRSGFAITEEDAVLFSTYFPVESDVFLLLKSNDFGPPTGGFVIREGGEVLSHSPYAEFQLDWVSALTSAHETPFPDLTGAAATATAASGRGGADGSTSVAAKNSPAAGVADVAIGRFGGHRTGRVFLRNSEA